MPLTLAFVQRLADLVAEARGGHARQVPDLGPATVMDQLTVLVWDYCATQPHAKAAELANELSGIRKGL